jgi:AraC-like DNA-binding protein
MSATGPIQQRVGLARGPVYFGDVIYQPGGECGPRVQKDFQLVILRTGELHLDLDEREVYVPAGSAILLSPGHREHFHFAREDRTHHAWCSIAAEAVPVPLREALEAESRALPSTPGLASLLELGLGLGPSTGSPLEAGYATGLALALCCEAARLARSGPPAPPQSEAAVAKARAFIEKEQARPLSLDRISRAAGVSRQHLLKLFRERGLPTPTDYLYARRLEAAAGLLFHTGLSIAEIAEQTGFANPYHFSRKFSQAHGRSPRAWRQALWAGSKAH